MTSTAIAATPVARSPIADPAPATEPSSSPRRRDRVRPQTVNDKIVHASFDRARLKSITNAQCKPGPRLEALELPAVREILSNCGAYTS